jgi:hypothetical protein
MERSAIMTKWLGERMQKLARSRSGLAPPRGDARPAQVATEASGRNDGVQVCRSGEIPIEASASRSGTPQLMRRPRPGMRRAAS